MSSDETAWDEAIQSTQSREFHRRLLKDIGLGLVALLCFAAYMTWSEPWVVVAGVVFVIILSWWSETRLDRRATWLPIKGRAVIITGCDTGFGHLLALHLDRLGLAVYAGCLDCKGSGAQKLQVEGSKRLHVVQMDVTSDTEVKQCLEYVIKTQGSIGLWGLVNNAGLNFLGDIELTTMQQFTRVTNINLLGCVRVTKAFLPLIRASKGRIVNVTSVKGKIVDPFNGAYAMSKFGMEAFSDSLRLEMKRFGVDVSIIEPGNFGGATGCMDMVRLKNDFETMWQDMSAECRDVYGRQYIDHHITKAEAAIPTASFNVQPVIDAITDAIISNKPKIRYLIPGGQKYDIYRWRIYLQQYIPTSIMDRWFLKDAKSFTDILSHHKQ